MAFALSKKESQCLISRDQKPMAWRGVAILLRKGFDFKYISFQSDEEGREKIYSLPSKVTLHTKLREFQYKVLNRILYTNEMLFKIKKVDSPRGYFCGTEIETGEHFFFYCSKVCAFWDEVTVMLNSQGITFRPFDIKDIVFAFFDPLT